MERAPGAAVTGRTIAAGGEGLGISAQGRRQAAVYRAVAVRAVGQVGVSRGADQGVVVAAGAIGRGHLDQAAVVRSQRMDRTPGGTVTGLAVAADGEGLEIGAECRHQAAVAVMAVRAVLEMRGRRRADQAVLVTARAVRAAGGDQGAVVRRRGGMQRGPGVRMTVRTDACGQVDLQGPEWWYGKGCNYPNGVVSTVQFAAAPRS